MTTPQVPHHVELEDVYSGELRPALVYIQYEEDEESAPSSLLCHTDAQYSGGDGAQNCEKNAQIVHIQLGMDKNEHKSGDSVTLVPNG
jgi:hypothetical protein